jgi:hypothetical protein
MGNGCTLFTLDILRIYLNISVSIIEPLYSLKLYLKEKESMKLNVTLDEQASTRFLAIKEHIGVISDLSVLQHVISREYRRIQRSKVRKVFLPKQVYDQVEQAANTRGQTIDEYIEEITKPILEEYKAKMEASKHGNS